MSPTDLNPGGETAESVRPSARITDRAQLLVVAALVVVGGYVIFDATQIDWVGNSNDPLGPKPVPILLGIALIITAGVYLIDVLRGGAGPREEGEDVETESRTDWRTLLLLAAAFLANALLIEPLGWVISSTILFWVAAFALGNRHHIRALLIAVGLALATFYGFAIGLGVNLPAGVLQGIL